MARFLFIAQQTLDAWMDQDKIEFEDNIMTIKADGRSFRLVEAVRFVAVEAGAEDSPGLVGRVKTNEQLAKMGAERYRDSVLYQDIPYKVQEGFIAEVYLRHEQPGAGAPAAEKYAPAADATGSRPEVATAAPRAAGETPAAALPGPQSTSRASPRRKRTPLESSLTAADKRSGEGGEEMSDEELLTKFLLENL